MIWYYKYTFVLIDCQCVFLDNCFGIWGEKIENVVVSLYMPESGDFVKGVWESA